MTRLGVAALGLVLCLSLLGCPSAPKSKAVTPSGTSQNKLRPSSEVRRLAGDCARAIKVTYGSNMADGLRRINGLLTRAKGLLSSARAGSDDYKVIHNALGCLYSTRARVMWVSAEYLYANAKDPRALTPMITGDASQALYSWGEYGLNRLRPSLIANTYCTRGRGHVIDAMAQKLANVDVTAREIIADANAAIQRDGSMWSAYALKAWAYLITGNAEGVNFAKQAYRLKPNPPREVLTVSLAMIIKKITAGSSGEAGGAVGRARAITDPEELMAIRQVGSAVGPKDITPDESARFAEQLTGDLEAQLGDE